MPSSLKRRLLAGVLALALLALPAGAGQAAPFPDVAPDSWYGEAVSEMAGQGYLTGCDDGTFQPQRPISHAEFITLCARCAHLSPAAGQGGHWAGGTLAAALAQGWYDYDELPPTGEKFDLPIPRFLAVKVLMKALLPQARGNYSDWAGRITDFSSLNGRYYEPTFAAYAAGVVTGDDQGAFRPDAPLSRAEAATLLHRALRLSHGQAATLPQATPAPTFTTRSGGVSENGPLQVVGTQLCNARGEPLLLRGMSSHGLQWYGQFASPGAIGATAQRGANLFRVALYTAEGGYLSAPQDMGARAVAAVDAAIAQDLYVILDWHILSDGDPMAHLDEALAFFTQMAQRYKDSPHVLFEICNEPNGGVTWSGQVKPYAQALVKAIRDQGAENVILIGSPTWSQDVHLPAADPVEGTNLMYTLHFYAGTHGQSLRDRAQAALDAGLPLFVSEWGTSRADGSGGVFLEEAAAWLDFLEERGISWCNWSLCDKAETSAALRPGSSPQGDWTEQDLSQSGAFVFSRLAPQKTETERVVEP